MPDATPFIHDVFLSHTGENRPAVRKIATRLRSDGFTVWFDEWELKSDDDAPPNIEAGLERSRILILCISATGQGPGGAQMQYGTLRFQDPLNKERFLVWVRVDEQIHLTPTPDRLVIDLRPGNWEQEYQRLKALCAIPRDKSPGSQHLTHDLLKRTIKLASCGDDIVRYFFSPLDNQVLVATSNNTLNVCDTETGETLRILKVDRTPIDLCWQPNQERCLAQTASGDVQLINTTTGKTLRDFKRSKLTRRQIECFRLLATGMTTRQIREAFGIHHLTMAEHLRELRVKLHMDGTPAVRSFSFRFYKNFVRYLKAVSDTLVPEVAWLAERERAFAGLHDREELFPICSHTGQRPWRSEWDLDNLLMLSGSDSGTILLHDARTNNTLHVFEGHSGPITSLAWNLKNGLAVSGSADRSLRIWDISERTCISVLNGHDRRVLCVSWNNEKNQIFSGDEGGRICMWDVSSFLTPEKKAEKHIGIRPRPKPDQVQYTNAKVLLVGETNSGKTALTHRLATGNWAPSDASTVGTWSTQLKLRDVSHESIIDREIWLWDFGGQADQRLVHQLYMDNAASILLLFNADDEDVLAGIRDWLAALRRSVHCKCTHFLVAGRIDTGFKASKAKLQRFASEEGLLYHETSAKTGEGCKDLRKKLIDAIPWNQVEKRTSPRIFKIIKDEIIKLRDEGQVLHTFKELRELLWKRLPVNAHFTDDTLETVIRLLDGPGIVKELDYGTYILLAPEWVNSYAQAVIRTLRSSENGLGVLPIRSIAEGKLIYQSVGRDGRATETSRLQPAEERVVLAEMERQLEQRGLCLRQGDKLVFPGHCGRDRPALRTVPSIFVSYIVKGYLDDIYATLAVKLADSKSFSLRELWRDAADFVTLTGEHHMGVKLTRNSANDGEVSIYFDRGVMENERVIFANYIHAHLLDGSEKVQRLRHYVCPHCNTPKGNSEVLMKKLLLKKKDASVVCDTCEARFDLWDDLEKLFASEEIRRQVEGLEAIDSVRLDTRRKGKLLALEVGSRITSANQKCFEIPATEDEGIDMELEFTEDDGKGTGKRLYLQLKSGNSHLETRASGIEVFRIKEQSWVKYWLKQPGPVMLVIGTFSKSDEHDIDKEKLEFAQVRWMEISSILRAESQDGRKPVVQIEFKGERLDMASIHRWRKRVL